MSRIQQKQEAYDYLVNKIDECKVADETYVIFSEIQDYVHEYNVRTDTYIALFNKCMDKYNELK